ncbi:MAG: hypothetical protein OEZ37_12405, partial [Gemmatimonadota bacterium]|nr:hypothetical protein [Gemmatimonadota bacterium]
MPRNAVVPARTAVLPILVIVAGLALVIPRLNRTSDLDEIRAEEDSVECGDLPGECATPSPEGLRTERTLRAADVCPRSGYLCVELAERDTFRIRRWTDGVSGLVVHVPAPDFEDAAPSRELHRAAVRGVKAWDGQPFAITVDERGRLDADVTVTWQRQLPGTRLGVTELQWSP